MSKSFVRAGTWQVTAVSDPVSCRHTDSGTATRVLKRVETPCLNIL